MWCASSVLTYTHKELRAAAEAFLGTILLSQQQTSKSHSDMARSFSLAKRALTFALHRRGYTVASDVSSRVVRGSRVVGKVEEKSVTKNGSESTSAWAPDPVTGYYRPINHTNEIDPVELRRMLLKHKDRSSST